jgi:hypothetical protein
MVTLIPLVGIRGLCLWARNSFGCSSGSLAFEEVELSRGREETHLDERNYGEMEELVRVAAISDITS